MGWRPVAQVRVAWPPHTDTKTFEQRGLASANHRAEIGDLMTLPLAPFGATVRPKDIMRRTWIWVEPAMITSVKLGEKFEDLPFSMYVLRIKDCREKWHMDQ